MTILISLAVFMPLPLGIAVLLLFDLYLISRRQFVYYCRQVKGSFWYFGFAILNLIVSLWHANLIGLGFGLFLISLGSYIGYFRRNITPEKFRMMTGLFIALSGFVAIVGFTQYVSICARYHIPWTSFEVMERPGDRITSVYMNANLYATICELAILLCIYRYTETPYIRSRVYYIFMAVVNLGMLYLTGCRTAFLPFLLIFPVYFLMKKKHKLLVVAVCGEMLCLIALLMFPNILPRMSNFSTMVSRIKIWKSALLMIQDNLIFGCGSHTYGLLWHLYNAHQAPHCHNIYIDTLCSYGIMGICLLGGYVATMWKEWKKSPLAIGALLIMGIHGVLDCTFNYPMTLMLLCIMLNAGKVEDLGEYYKKSDFGNHSFTDIERLFTDGIHRAKSN